MRNPALASRLTRSLRLDQDRVRPDARARTRDLVEAPLVVDGLLVIGWAVARLFESSQWLMAVVVVGSIVALRWPATGAALAGLAFIFPLQLGSVQAGAPLIATAGIGCLIVAARQSTRLGVPAAVVFAAAIAATTGLALLRLMAGPLHEIAAEASVRWAGLTLGLISLPIHLFLIRQGSRHALAILVAASAVAIGIGLIDGLWPRSLDKTVLGPLLSKVPFDRATGPFPSPNRLGTVAAVAAVCAAVLARDRRGWWAYVLWLGAALATMTVLASFSRGALLGLAVAAVVVVARHSLRLAVVAAVLGAVAIFVVTPAFMDARLGSAPTSSGLPAEQAANDAGRIEAWLAGLRMGAAQPITGQGFGAFAVVGPRYGGPANLETAHNELIALFGDAGLPAAISFSGLIAACVWAFRRRSVANDLGLAAILVFVTASSFNVQSVFPQVTTLVWALVGASLALASNGSTPIDVGRNEHGKGKEGEAHGRALISD